MSERKSPRDRITEIATFLYEEHMNQVKCCQCDPVAVNEALEAKLKSTEGSWYVSNRQIAALEEKCSWQAEMLERAKTLIVTHDAACDPIPPCVKWFGDLKKGPTV